MAYARYGQDSDVYMFETGVAEIECCGCRFSPSRSPSFRTRSEAIAHLRNHRSAGHKVPDWAFEDLAEEVGRLGDLVRAAYLVDCGDGRVECRDCGDHGGLIALKSQEAVASHRAYHERESGCVCEPYTLPERSA